MSVFNEKKRPSKDTIDYCNIGIFIEILKKKNGKKKIYIYMYWKK